MDLCAAGWTGQGKRKPVLDNDGKTFPGCLLKKEHDSQVSAGGVVDPKNRNDQFPLCFRVPAINPRSSKSLLRAGPLFPRLQGTESPVEQRQLGWETRRQVSDMKILLGCSCTHGDKGLAGATGQHEEVNRG